MLTSPSSTPAPDAVPQPIDLDSLTLLQILKALTFKQATSIFAGAFAVLAVIGSGAFWLGNFHHQIGLQSKKNDGTQPNPGSTNTADNLTAEVNRLQGELKKSLAELASIKKDRTENANSAIDCPKGELSQKSLETNPPKQRDVSSSKRETCRALQARQTYLQQKLDHERDRNVLSTLQSDGTAVPMNAPAIASLQSELRIIQSGIEACAR